MSTENKTFYYAQISDSFFNDSSYKRMRRRLPDCKNITAIYLKIILEAVKGSETTDPEEIKIIYFHDEDTFAEEVAYNIGEDVEEVETVIAYMLKYGLMTETEQDEFQVCFPEGTVGSIKASSRRSRECRERQRRKRAGGAALQCNTDATPMQHLCNTDATNIKEREREGERENQIKSDSNSNSDSYVTVTGSTLNLNYDPAAACAAADARALEGGASPAQRQPLFSFDEVKKSADRRRKDKLTDAEIAAMYDDFVSNDFKRCRKFMDDGDEKSAALFHAVNAWAKQNHKEGTTDTEAGADAWEFEDLKAMTDGELKKMFPAGELQGVFYRKYVEWAFSLNDDRATFDTEGYFDEFEEDMLWENARRYADPILRRVEKYMSKKLCDFEYRHEDFFPKWIHAVFDNASDGWEAEILVPYFVPAKEFTTEQRRLMYTFWGIRFPVGTVELLKDPFKDTAKV